MKKFTIVLLAIIIIIAGLPQEALMLRAETKSSVICETENYKIEFKVNSQWDAGMEGQVIITNMGSEPIENWRLKLNFMHEITSLWDAEIESHDNEEYVIKYPAWNPVIPSGGKAVIGFNAKVNGNIKVPVSCSLLNQKEEADKEDYTITYRTTSDWNDAFNGEISITNNSNLTIENWQLEFDFDSKMNQLWNAVKIKEEKGHYVMKHADWNSIIKPGETIKLGFEAKPGNGDREPRNYQLTKAVFDSESTVPEEPEESEFPHFTEEELKIDTDQDGIPDCMELVLELDPKSADTDGDGLPDYFEFRSSGTDPKKKDTNDNGITDDKEDEDKDGLNNLEETKYGTYAFTDDTDEDDLTDGDEVNQYKTDPAKSDTDGDGLSDGDEIALKLDPLKQDTDGNGIADKDEKIDQTEEMNIAEPDLPAITKVEVQIKGTGYMKSTTDITNYYKGEVYSSEAAGIMGAPVNVASRSVIDSASIVFYYKPVKAKSMLENLGILYYNEADETFTLLESSIDTNKQTIRASIPNTLGTFLVVDKNTWKEVWENPIYYGNKKLASKGMDMAYVIDHSESMTTKRLDKAKAALSDFIGSMGEEDRAALFTFTAYDAAMISKIGTNKGQLKKAVKGLTIGLEKTKETKPEPTINEGLKKAVEHLTDNPSSNPKAVVLIVDGEMRYDEKIIAMAKENKIAIFVINIGKETEASNLKKMIKKATGYFYDADTTDDILNSLLDIRNIYRLGVDRTDTDGDGLYDVYEKLGVRLSNGQIMDSDPNRYDTDGDSLSDFEEMNGSRVYFIEITHMLGDVAKNSKQSKKSEMKKSKSKVKIKDTDGDGDNDAIDPRRRSFHINDACIDKLDQLDKLAVQYCKNNKIDKKKHNWYVFMMLRNLGSHYDSSFWNILAGTVDSKFIDYVKKGSPDLYQYFKKNKTINSNQFGAPFDLHHFGGTMSINIYETNAIKDNSIYGLAFEHNLNDMGGWAGDLQQVVTQKTKEMKILDAKKYYDNIYKEINLKNGKYFGIEDYSADLDAIQIYKLLQQGYSIKESFLSYYGDRGQYLYRTKNFVTMLQQRGFGIDEEVLLYTNLKYMNRIWPFYNKHLIKDELKERLNKERSKIARDAFVDYIKKNQETYFFPAK